MERIEFIDKINELRLKEYCLSLFINNKDLNTLKKLYNYVKVLESNQDVNSSLKELTLRRYVYEGEDLFSDKYLIPNNPKFFLYRDINDVDFHLAASILDYIVNEARRIMFYGAIISDSSIELSEISTMNKCFQASMDVRFICDKLGIKSKIYKILPGFSGRDNIFNRNCIHYIVLIELMGKEFLIDTTYSQFFLVKKNILDRLGIINIRSLQPGCFMTMEKERLKVAKKVLRDGWLELTDSNLKNYFDGFALSYRNGLYYENTRDFSYQTEYTADDYRRFIRGEDNQVNHEEKEFLGYQKVPLKNPYLVFTKR